MSSVEAEDRGGGGEEKGKGPKKKKKKAGKETKKAGKKKKKKTDGAAQKGEDEGAGKGKGGRDDVTVADHLTDWSLEQTRLLRRAHQQVRNNIFTPLNNLLNLLKIYINTSSPPCTSTGESARHVIPFLFTLYTPSLPNMHLCTSVIACIYNHIYLTHL